MRRTTAFLSLASLLVPAAAFALDTSDSTSRYKDARTFSDAERAGISVLTNMHVVQGNPDGSFAARRTLNRAEYVKIAMALRGNVSSAGSMDGVPCFPDVPDSAWFSPYICSAKDQGVVQGNPDGLFHPERAVNYAEAIKILVELYKYQIPDVPGEWYLKYVEAADRTGVLLPEQMSFGTFLTRGQMARLAAAFQASDEGELEAYRDAERGVFHSSVSSAESSPASSVPPVSSVTSSFSSSTSSNSSTSSPSALFPTRSHFLLIGKTTWPVMDGTFTAVEEDLIPSISDLTLRREVRSIDKMWMVDEQGTEIMQFLLKTDDNTDKRKWKGQVIGSSYRLKKGVPTILAVKVLLKDRVMGGSSGELFEVENWLADFVGAATGNNRQLAPTSTHYPLHPTAQAELKKVTNALETSGTLQQGLRKIIGAFTFSGTTIPGAELRLMEVNLRVEKSGVNVSKVRIGGTAEVEQADCSVDSADPTSYFCSSIPESIDDVGGGRTLWITADVTVTGTQGTLRLSLPEAGTMGKNGSVRWTDGTSNFNWIDSASPLATGTMWTVTK